MRALLGLVSLLSVPACARDEVPLGTETPSNTGGGNSAGSGDNASGSPTGGSSMDRDAAVTGGGNNAGNSAGSTGDANNGSTGDDAGGGTGAQCVAASCTSPMEAGSIESDVDGTAVTVMGMGHAFVKVLAPDGQSTGNSAGGIRATLSSANGSNYDLFALGGPSDACTDLGISSANPAGQDDSVAPLWGVNGPVVAVDWTVTFEVRPADGKCDEPWTLKLEGNPCEMPFAPSIPKQCP